MENQIKKTQKNTILMISVTIILVTNLYFWCEYILNKSDDLVNKRHQYEEEIVNAMAPSEIEQRKLMANNYSSFFNSLYIDANDAVGFITFIESIAKDADLDVNIQSINSSIENNNVENNDYHTIEMSFVVRGGWQNINNFILMIESLPHHISINELKLNSTTDSENQIAWAASISFVGIAK